MGSNRRFIPSILLAVAVFILTIPDPGAVLKGA
jgi:hypothetical protein